MTKTIIQVDGFAYTYKDFPSLESFYKYSLDNVVVFSIDGADWFEHGKNTLKATDKAILANKRFLHHFLSQFGSDQIVLLEGCYDNRKEFSYAVSDKLFYTFVQELGYVSEQHSYLLLEVIKEVSGVFSSNRRPVVELIENGSGDTLISYSRIENIVDCGFPPDALGYTYCNKSDNFYSLVDGVVFKNR